MVTFCPILSLERIIVLIVIVLDSFYNKKISSMVGNGRQEILQICIRKGNDNMVIHLE